MTNEELVVRIQNNIDVADNMLLLWQQIKPFIRSVALHYKGYAELEDLEQEGYLALYDAVDGFDPDAGYTFLTYAKNWIKQKMLLYIQNNGTVRIPVHEWGKIRRLQKVIREFRARYGREPEDYELCMRLDVTMEQLKRMQQAHQMEHIGSLDKVITGSEDETTVGEQLATNEDLECFVIDRMQQEHLKRKIWALVDLLPDEQSQVIRMKYIDELPLQQVGKITGCGKRVYDLYRNGIRKLRSSENTFALMPFLPEEQYAAAYRGNGVQSFNRSWTSSTERVALRMV